MVELISWFSIALAVLLGNAALEVFSGAAVAERAWSSLAFFTVLAGLLAGLGMWAVRCWQQRLRAAGPAAAHSAGENAPAEGLPAEWLHWVRAHLPARRATYCYALSGAVFGLCFPVVASCLASYLETGWIDWSGVAAAQRGRPLLWIIDTAPFWLGLSASLAGRREDRLSEVNDQLEEELQRRHRYEERLRSAQKRAVTARVEAEGLREHAEVARRKAEAAHRTAVAARDEAQEAARLKSAILNSVSHELRTPLSSIIGFAEVLSEETTGQQSEFSGLIARSGRRLQETVNSVLEMARLESGAVALCYERIDVHAEVEELVALFQPVAQRKDLALRAEVEGPREAHLDRTCLGRILRNLIGNAIKFTEAGRVTVRARTSEDAVVVAVEDTGVGIGEAFMPQLFEAFRQESEGLARLQEGSGLGLSISKHLVEQAGGTLSVESEKGAGSTFTLRLPQRKAAAHANAA